MENFIRLIFSTRSKNIDVYLAYYNIVRLYGELYTIDFLHKVEKY